MTLNKSKLKELSQPFSTKEIRWKPGATNQDKTRALALAYVDPRHYQQRLDDILGPDWSDTYEVHRDGSLFICNLTAGGVTRSDVGEKDGKDQNTATSAKAQAFKRACVAFGLGRYLYNFPQKWVAYDKQRKRFTEGGVSELTKLAERYHKMIGIAPSPTEDQAPTAAPKKQQPARAKPADALDDTPTISTPPEFLAALKPLEYYNHGKHALNTLNKVDGTDLTTWPLDNPQFYADALETLTNYANEQRALDKENAQAVISEAARQASF